MAEHQVLFCPFCRECFEGSVTCPTHELTLVPFTALPPSDDDDELDDGPYVSPEDRVVALLDPGGGRALVALGAVLDVLALGLPLAHPAQGRALATYELARVLPSLWTLGLVSFTALFVLARRRTPRSLRGMRVLVPLLALFSLFTVASALVKLGAGLRWGAAIYVIGVASVMLLLGGLRLGTARVRAQ